MVRPATTKEFEKLGLNRMYINAGEVSTLGLSWATAAPVVNNINPANTKTLRIVVSPFRLKFFS
jgi:hypothetical protein